MVTLRLATPEDYELIMAWRSHPDNYKGFFTQKSALTWEEHIKWMESRKNWREFIILYDDRKVGIITLGQLDHWSPECGICIGETTLQGKGVGREATLQALQWLRGHGYGYCHTTILKTNEKSLRMFQGVGFTVTGDARPGEVWLTKQL